MGPYESVKLNICLLKRYIGTATKSSVHSRLAIVPVTYSTVSELTIAS